MGAAPKVGIMSTPLQRFVKCLQADMVVEIERRKNPGNLYLGLPRLEGVPMSVLMKIERDARHALDMDNVGLLLEVIDLAETEEGNGIPANKLLESIFRARHKIRNGSVQSKH